MTFLVGTNCYMVRCYSASSCKTKKPSTPSSFDDVSITPYRWFGELQFFYSVIMTRLYWSSVGVGLEVLPEN